jgi:hypothetical protein
MRDCVCARVHAWATCMRKGTVMYLWKERGYNEHGATEAVPLSYAATVSTRMS